MIVLVISMHAADTYSPLGNWYFTDRTPLTPAALTFFAAWQTYLQSFFMGLLFFVAGCFVPAALDRKGTARFLRDRARRLGLPVLFYMFVLGPVTEYYVAHSWTSTQPTSMANEWIKHIRNGQFLQENGPLWFCLALLIFCVAYAAVHTARRSAGSPSRAVPQTAGLAVFALGMAAFSFTVRGFRPGSVLNMHLGDFPQYTLLFGAGILSAQNAWLEKLPRRSGVRWLQVGLPAGLILWAAMLAVGGGLHGDFSAFSGGWHWQSAAFCLWESFTCVTISFGLIVIYRDRLNTQGSWRKFLSDNAFSVYVFHPPIVILGARWLHTWAGPPVAKFAILTLMAAGATFALSAAVFRRIPLLREIL